MNRFLILLAFSVSTFSIPSFSQTQLSDIINHYTKILEIDFCTGKTTVTGVTGFQEGDRVIVLQMQGALINETNSASFGNISDIQTAGFYEIHTIDSISGNEIFFENTFLQELDVNGSLQIVSYPAFADAVVTSTLTAQPWDGSTGGVLAFEVSGQLTLEADIDVSGIGFRGGAINVVTSDCTFLTNADAYFYALTNWRGAPKGEGVAKILPGKEQGRGAQANGGGGGNDHNSGGGGGSNFNAGGIGGNQNVGGFGCDGIFAGKGGVALAPATDRIFLGGGGGSGHTDDTGAGTPGANGGGIVILAAESISGNGKYIRSNGNTPSLSGGDGSGGGGAGGTILLLANNLSGNLQIEAKGGDGGSVQNTSDRCFGAGGGGGGGRLLTNVTGFSAVQLAGGEAGVNLTPSSQCNGASNGATNGSDGEQADLLNLPLASGQFPLLTLLGQMPVIFACEGEQIVVPSLAQGVNGNSLHWQINTGNGWVNLQNGTEYGGVSTLNLLIFSPGISMQGATYRCTAESQYCGEVVSTSVSLEIAPLPVAAFDVVSQGNNTFQFVNQSQNANDYLWDFDDGDTSTEASPTHDFDGNGSAVVTLTVSNDCGEAVFSQTVEFGSLPLAAFASESQGTCAPVIVSFEDQSTGQGINAWQWAFEGGDPATSILQNPSVTYTLPGTYDVSLTVANAFGEHTAVQPDLVSVFESPLAAFTFEVAANVVTFQNESVAGTSFSWDFGDGESSAEANPVHTYAQPAVYEVSLTVSNSGCGSAISQDVGISTTGSAEAEWQSGFRVFPNPADGFFYLEKTKAAQNRWDWRLFDVTGKAVLSGEAAQKLTRISWEMFPSGMYYFEVWSEKKRLHLAILKL